MDADGRCKSEPDPSWTPLGSEIAARIAADGPIGFAEFMEAALYHPELGYYAADRRRWGPAGDYLTTPQVHPAVGFAIAALAAEIDRALGGPDPFTLVEFGCGDGQLLATVTGSLRERWPALYARLQVVAIERGTCSRRRLGELDLAPPRRWVVAESMRDPAVPDRWRGLVLSNELLDAFPVERVTRREGRLLQSRIAVQGDRLVERFDGELSDEVARYLADNAILLEEGQEAEVCPAVAAWLEAVSARLEMGGLLTIDYGHETTTLYGPSRPRGTLVCQRRFDLDDAPLEAIGHKDITAHVDFGNLRRLGCIHGLAAAELTSLRVFLLGFGAAALEAAGWPERLALRHLLVSEVGDQHRVLLQTRGLPPGEPPFGRVRLDDRPAPGSAAGAAESP